MKVLGKAKVKYKGEVVEGVVCDDGTLIMPDGKKKKLDKQQFENLKTQLQPEVLPQRAEPAEQVLNTVQINPFPEYDLTAERKMEQKRRIKIAIGVLVFLIILAISGFLVVKYAPQLVGLAPNAYKVVVANTDIEAGSIIENGDISFVELSRDEYSAQCVDTYMAENGSMQADEPIFFINANNHVVGKFAAEDISQGEIIKESMVTTQRYEGQVEIDGETQDVQLTESQIGGQTNITFIARIEQEDGTTQDVVLSTMKLQGRSLSELLNSSGESILENSEGAGTEPAA